MVVHVTVYFMVLLKSQQQLGIADNRDVGELQMIFCMGRFFASRGGGRTLVRHLCHLRVQPQMASLFLDCNVR